MIKVTANINGEKREVTNYSYQCNLRFCDFPNFAQLIMIYKSVKCKEPPVEGDLITLTFNSTGKESFFYEWIISGDVYDGEIEFVCNEVDVVDIFRFWDCYCVGIEESMSIGGSPMSCTVYLSPGIIKRNNLPVREKVWKISDINIPQHIVAEDERTAAEEEKKVEVRVYDEQIQVVDYTGTPIDDLLYFVEYNGREIASGRTNSEGLTCRLGKDGVEKEFIVYLGEDALEKMLD